MAFGHIEATIEAGITYFYGRNSGIFEYDRAHRRKLLPRDKLLLCQGVHDGEKLTETKTGGRVAGQDCVAEVCNWLQSAGATEHAL